MLTQENLKSVLDYNQETGVFTWKVKLSPKAMPGSIAGTLNSQGYISIRLFGIQYKAHRLAFFYMNGFFPHVCIDHINNTRNDNRWANLREATIAQNFWNVSLSNKNRSGFKGVHLCRLGKKWIATCRVNGKKFYIGRFDTPQLASFAHSEFARLHHGEFFKE